MNRSAKRHRSTKVPNVKLRPAPVGTSAASERRRLEAEAEKEDLAHYRRLREIERTGKGRIGDDNDDEDDDDNNNGEGDDDSPPLLGCVICTTGITEEKAKLTEYATTLGGIVKGNLTEDTTHLIAVEPGSKKYRCAVTLGLPILRPDWLKELRARWTGDIAFDFDGLMEEHRLDTFEKVVAALAGITEPSERTEVRRKLKSGSAVTPTTFQLDGSFTHLICQDIKKSQTMEAVNRFRSKAQRWLRRGEELPDEGEPYAKEMRAAVQLQTVWAEWVDDCLEVQGCIDEKFYSVNEPRMTIAQRKDLIESIQKAKTKQMEMGKSRKVAALLVNDDDSNAKRAMTQVKETPSNGNNEVQRVTKKPKYDIEQYVKELSKVETEGPVRQNDADEKENRSLFGLTKAQAFTEHLVLPQSNKRTLVDQSVSPSSHIINLDEELPRNEQIEDDDVQLEEDPAAGLQSELREKSLSSLSFRLDLRSDDSNDAIRKALEERGVCNILEAQDRRAAHFHVLPLNKEPITSSSKNSGVPVTRFFIERCLYESRVLSLSESFALQPAIVPLPLQGAEKVFVGLTGLPDEDRMQAQIALKVAGIEATSTLKRNHHTHLLVGKTAEDNKSSQVKIERAKQWGVHCVGLDFIDKIYRRGVVEPAVVKVGKLNRVLQTDRGMSRSESMGASTIGETQRLDSQGLLGLQSEYRPLGVIEQASNLPLNMSRPWQRSASSSQALLDGEVSRGVPLRSSYARYHNVDSLEAGSQAIKTSAEEVMALLSSRPSGDTSFDSSTSSSSNARKRGRLPPSRLRERRAGSATTIRQERTPSEIPTAEELLAMRKEEEDLFQANHSTQAATMSTQEDQSMRVTYDDPISRRERRKIGDLIATSVKDKAQQEEAGSSSSTEVEEEQPGIIRTSSMSPLKRRSISKTSFSPSIKARRQPGTCLRD